MSSSPKEPSSKNPPIEVKGHGSSNSVEGRQPVPQQQQQQQQQPQQPQHHQQQHHHHHHHHHHRRLRNNSVSSSHNEGSSDNLSGYASSFDSASSFSDDFLGFQGASETLVEIYHGERKIEMVIDENLQSTDLCQLLVLKLNLSRNSNWAIVFQLVTLGLERVLEDHEEVLPLLSTFSGNGNLQPRLQVRQSLSKYEFILNPTSSFHLDMIEFGHSDEYEVPNRIKMACLQDQLMCSESLNLLISGSLRYYREVGTASGGQVNESFSAFAELPTDDGTLTLSDINAQRKVALKVDQHQIFQPIDGHDPGPNSAARLARSSSNTGNCFLFALINEEDKVGHWLSTNSDRQRLSWISVLRIVKYGMGLLRSNYYKNRKEVATSSNSPSSGYLTMAGIGSPPELGYEFTEHQETSIEHVRPRSGQSSATGLSAGGRSASMPIAVPRPGATQSNRIASRSPIIDRNPSSLHLPWFYPDIGRDEANTSLQKYLSVDGVFLVRPSSRVPNTMVLSFIFREKINHVQIQTLEESGQASLSLDYGKTKFYDLKQLIEFYQLNNGCLPVKLTHYLIHR